MHFFFILAQVIVIHTLKHDILVLTTLMNILNFQGFLLKTHFIWLLSSLSLCLSRETEISFVGNDTSQQVDSLMKIEDLHSHQNSYAWAMPYKNA